MIKRGVDDNAVLGGVCYGIAKHLGIDPSVVRLLALASIFFSASITFWVYIILWIVLPKEEEE